MNKYGKILSASYKEDSRSSTEIIVEKLKHLRKNVLHMSPVEFSAGLFPSNELNKIEKYSSSSNAMYIRELAEKYDVDSYIIDLNENIGNILDNMLLCIMKNERYDSELVENIDDLKYKSNYTLLIIGLKLLLLEDKKNLGLHLKSMLSLSNEFNKLQSQILILLATGLEILNENYILAYETIILLKTYEKENKYIDIVYKYFLAKSCFFCSNKVFALVYINDFLKDEYSNISHAKFVEISEYRLVLVAEVDTRTAIMYAKRVFPLVNNENFNLLLDIIDGREINYNKIYSLTLFEVMIIFDRGNFDNLKYDKLIPKTEVEKNLLLYLNNQDDFTLLRRSILPIYRKTNPFYFNVLNNLNLQELKSRSRYKEMVAYMWHKYVGTK